MAICNAVQTSSAGMVASTPHDLARIQVQYGGQIQLAAFGADDVPPILNSPQFGVQCPTPRRLGVKKRFPEEQIIGLLREAEAGVAIKDLCRRHGFSEASY